MKKRTYEPINSSFTISESDEDYIVSTTILGIVSEVLNFGNFSKSIGKQEEETIEFYLDDEDDYDE